MWLSGGNCTSSTLHGGADHPLCTAPVIFWSGDQQSGSFGGRRAESKWDSGSWETTRSGRASQTELGGPRRTRQPTRRESKRWATRTCAPTCYSRGRPTAPVQFFYIKMIGVDGRFYHFNMTIKEVEVFLKKIKLSYQYNIPF